MRPYIGITGFAQAEEIQQIYDSAPVLARLDRPQGSHDLMVGILASNKTLAGQTNRYAHRYPDTLRLDTLCRPRPGVMTLVHYHAPDSQDLAMALGVLTVRAGVHGLDGFQLNLTWPDPEQICRHRENYPGHQIVLQLGSGALKKMDDDPEKVTDRLGRYAYCVDSVLVDASGGRGEPLDLKRVTKYVEVLQDTDFGIGIAGGLDAAALPQLKTLTTRFPWLSIDAEGKLRRPDDTLDLTIAQEYLQEALGLFCEATP